MKRWGKTPPKLLADVEVLIRDSNYSVTKCCEIVGIESSLPKVWEFAHRYRKYLGKGRWIDLQTGEVRPRACDTQCAIEATGLSSKTILRRRQAGLIATKRLVSSPQLLAFTPFDIRRLKQIGKLKGGKPVLSEDDVREIRRLGDRGQSAREISEHYPQVQRKQIRRILNRTRWKDLK